MTKRLFQTALLLLAPVFASGETCCFCCGPLVITTPEATTVLPEAFNFTEGFQVTCDLLQQMANGNHLSTEQCQSLEDPQLLADCGCESVGTETPATGTFVNIARINCGGYAFTDPDGTEWEADRYFIGGYGNIQAPHVVFANTSNDELFRPARVGISEPADLDGFSYSIPVQMEPGTYQVVLYFAEHLGRNNPGERVFDVTLEGNITLANFDIAREAGGGFIALQRSFQVEVTDGSIDVDLRPSVNVASLSGIAIYMLQDNVPQDPEPTSSPTVLASSPPSVKPSDKPTSPPTTKPTSNPSIFAGDSSQTNVSPTVTASFPPSIKPSDNPTSPPSTEPSSSPPVCLDNECAGDGYVYVCAASDPTIPPNTHCVDQETATLLLKTVDGASCGKCPILSCSTDLFSCGNGKVQICHIEARAFEDVCISSSALDAHQENHCDYCGKCQDELPPDCELVQATPRERGGFLGFWCFSGQNTVHIEGHQHATRIDKLKIGDSVMTLDGSFATVYSFGHHDLETLTEFLAINTNDASHLPLEITSDHMLFIRQKVTKKTIIVPAQDIQVGDELVSTENGAGEGGRTFVVTSIRTVKRRGAYAPFTTSGTLLVNGIAASNYIALPSSTSTLFQKHLSFKKQHWLQHMAYLPYRAYCSLRGCENEQYDANTHLSPAVMFWLPFLHWIEHTVSNKYLFSKVAASLVTAVLGYLFWRSQTKAVIKK